MAAAVVVVVTVALAAVVHAHDHLGRLDCPYLSPAMALQRDNDITSLWASAWRRVALSCKLRSSAAYARAASAASNCSTTRLAACSYLLSFSHTLLMVLMESIDARHHLLDLCHDGQVCSCLLIERALLTDDILGLSSC